MSATNAFVDRAMDLIPTLAARADDTEKRRQLLPETIADIKARGFHRMSQPKRYGGAEQPLQQTADTVTRLARGCASTAWVVGLWNDHSIILSKLDPKAAEDVWASSPDAVISAGYFPSGTNARANGGWTISGTWGWASGCDYADWLFLGSMLQLGEGAPVACLCLVPRADVTIDDNWHVMGLSGTGSKNIVVKSAFVPDHRILPLPHNNLGIPPGRTGLAPLHQLPHVPNVPFLFLSSGIGMAESLLENIVERISQRANPLAKLAELQSMQLHIAESAAEIDCARALMMRDLSESMALMEQGGTLSLRQRARNRRDQAYGAMLVRRAADRLFATAGSQGMFNDSIAQRKFRDICAFSTHISMSWDIAGTTYGRVTLGLDPATFLI